MQPVGGDRGGFVRHAARFLIWRRGRAQTTPKGAVDASSRRRLAAVQGGYRAAMAGGEVLRVTPTVAIPLEELEWRFTGSGGPGGQHANTSNTRVEVRFDVVASPSLGP